MELFCLAPGESVYYCTLLVRWNITEQLDSFNAEYGSRGPRETRAREPVATVRVATARRNIMLSRRVSGDRYACVTVCACFNVFIPFPFSIYRRDLWCRRQRVQTGVALCFHSFRPVRLDRDDMEASCKAQRRRTAFYFCTLLNALVSAQSANCFACHQNITYAADADGIVRKRRAAKLGELQRSMQSRDVAFQLHGFGNSFNRTKKHHTSHRQAKSFIVDSGASATVTNRLDLFESIEDYHPNKRVQVANKQFVHVQLVGTVRLTLSDDSNKPYTILLRNVYYSPHCNLLSVEELYKQHGISTKFGADCELQTRDGARIPIPRTGERQYWLHAYAFYRL